MRDRRWTKRGICLNCRDYKNCGGGAMHLWDEKRDTVLTCINTAITPLIFPDRPVISDY
jgi:hypothetical protein